MEVVIRGITKIQIDEDDWQKISHLPWRRLGINNKPYMVCKMNGMNSYRMHRLIMGVNDPKIIIDHINGDTFDNRKCNLRICTQNDNVRNCKIPITNTSGYKGASKLETKGLPSYRSYIVVKDKQIHLGCYADPIDADKCYNSAAVKYFGEFARLNPV